MDLHKNKMRPLDFVEDNVLSCCSTSAIRKHRSWLPSLVLLKNDLPITSIFFEERKALKGVHCISLIDISKQRKNAQLMSSCFTHLLFALQVVPIRMLWCSSVTRNRYLCVFFFSVVVFSCSCCHFFRGFCIVSWLFSLFFVAFWGDSSLTSFSLKIELTKMVHRNETFFLGLKLQSRITPYLPVIFRILTLLVYSWYLFPRCFAGGMHAERSHEEGHVSCLSHNQGEPSGVRVCVRACVRACVHACVCLPVRPLSVWLLY